MRIISGKYKGRNFNNKLPNGIRPTQNAMRETIFNILNNYINFDDKIVADICSGAGMLGIESLSRNAKFVYFVDKNRKSIEYISNNLKLISAENENFKLVNLDAIQFVNHFVEMKINPKNAQNEAEKLDVIFVDPPYNTNIYNDVIFFANENNLMKKDGILIAESAIHTIISIPENFEKLTERQFGASKVTFLKIIS